MIESVPESVQGPFCSWLYFLDTPTFPHLWTKRLYFANLPTFFVGKYSRRNVASLLQWPFRKFYCRLSLTSSCGIFNLGPRFWGFQELLPSVSLFEQIFVRLRKFQKKNFLRTSRLKFNLKMKIFLLVFTIISLLYDYLSEIKFRIENFAWRLRGWVNFNLPLLIFIINSLLL